MNESVEDLERKLFDAKLMACETIEDRVAFLLLAQRKHHGHWEWVAVQTGIPSKRWRQVLAKKQRITSDMMESLCRWMPDYAFWIVTGVLPTLDVKHSIPTYERIDEP